MFKKSYLLIGFTLFATGFVSVPPISAQQFSEWSTPVNLGPIVNSACSAGTTTCNDMRPGITKDGLSLYFESDRPGGCGGFDIWVSHRATRDSEWDGPVNLGCTINSSA